MFASVPIRCCGRLASRRRPVGALSLVCLAVLAGVLATNAGSRARATSTVLATAVVVGADKQPVPNASVYVYYVPEAAKVAKSVPLAEATTDDGGKFTLFAKYSSTLKKLSAPNGGWLNLDLLVVSGPLTLYLGVPRFFGPTGWIGPQVGGSVDLGTLLLAPDAPGVGGKGRRISASRAAAQICVQVTTELQTANLSTIVGELHTYNGPATFTYGPHAHTQVAVPSSASSTGPWSVPSASTDMFSNLLTGGGSVAFSNPAAIANYALYSNFRYRKLVITNTCAATKWVVKPKEWLGKTTKKSTKDFSAHCTTGSYATAHKLPRLPGQTFTRTSGTAYQYPTGVSETTLGVLGPSGAAVHIFSESDYGTYVRAHWSFPTAGSLCGDTALPASSLRIFAGG